MYFINAKNIFSEGCNVIRQDKYLHPKNGEGGGGQDRDIYEIKLWNIFINIAKLKEKTQQLHNKCYTILVPKMEYCFPNKNNHEVRNSEWALSRNTFSNYLMFLMNESMKRLFLHG